MTAGHRTTRRPRGILVVGVTLVATVAGGLVAAPAFADSSLVVTNTGDTGTGTLRSAIDTANTTVGTETITFDLPDTTPADRQIVVSTPLPTITDQVTIDATVASGRRVQVIDTNTNYSLPGADSVLRFQGASAGNSRVYGLSIVKQGAGDGIAVRYGVQALLLDDVLIGLTQDGLESQGSPMSTGVNASVGPTDYVSVAILNSRIGNVSTGVRQVGPSVVEMGADIFGLTAGDLQVGLNVAVQAEQAVGTTVYDSEFGYNASSAIIASDINNLSIDHNLFGVDSSFVDLPTDPAGAAQISVASGASGLSILDNYITHSTAAGIEVNGFNSGGITGNTIRGNGVGIQMASTNHGVILQNNSIYGNSGLGIDVGTAGVNEGGPTITDATPGSDGVGTASVTAHAGLPYDPTTIDVYSNDVCDPSGYGEGKYWVASFSGTSDANGNITADVPVLGNRQISIGDILTATTSQADGPPSEFSPCFDVAAATPGADLSLSSLVDSPDPVSAGGAITYTTTVTNLGPDPAVNPRVDFDDPSNSGFLTSGLTFLNGTVTSDHGGSGYCNEPDVGSAVTCHLDSSVPADGAVWTVTVSLGTTESTPSSVTVRATASSQVGDPNFGNNQAQATTDVGPASNDSITEPVPTGPDTQTVTTATDTQIVNGQVVPVATLADPTTVSVDVPPNSPSGVLTLDESDLSGPPVPGLPSFVLAQRQFDVIPTGFAPTTRLRDTVVFDASLLGGVRVKGLGVYQSKDGGTSFSKLPMCSSHLKSGCVKVIKKLWVAGELHGDLRVVFFARVVDPRLVIGK